MGLYATILFSECWISSQLFYSPLPSSSRCSLVPLHSDIRYHLHMCAVLCLDTQSCPTPCHSMTLAPPGSSVHGDSPGKNTGVSCHALLYCIFPTQESNPCLPHWHGLFAIWASIYEIVDISHSKLDWSLWFILPDILHDVLCIEAK